MSEERSVGLALLSFAHFHQRKWAETFLGDRRASVLGLWDGDTERGLQAAREYGIPFFHELDALLSHPGVEAAAICSETKRHVELTKRCCRKRLDILCEKPTAKSLEEGREMQREVAAANVRYVQSFPQRMIPGNHTIKGLLEDGAIGRITHVRKRHGHGFFLSGLEQDMPWVVDPELAGGGAFLDEGVHETDLLRYFFGDPVSVVAQMGCRASSGVETSGTAVYRFPDDTLASIESGWRWVAGGPTTEIYGDEGTIIQSGLDCASNAPGTFWPPLSLYRKRIGRWEKIGEPFDFSTIHTLAPLAFLDTVARDADPPSTIEDGLKALEMVLAAYRSAGTGERVEFPL